MELFGALLEGRRALELTDEPLASGSGGEKVGSGRGGRGSGKGRAVELLGELLDDGSRQAYGVGSGGREASEWGGRLR